MFLVATQRRKAFPCEGNDCNAHTLLPLREKWMVYCAIIIVTFGFHYLVA
jgi:hypothetical protein